MPALPLGLRDRALPIVLACHHESWLAPEGDAT
jgi:hypothetical protein